VIANVHPPRAARIGTVIRRLGLLALVTAALLVAGAPAASAAVPSGFVGITSEDVFASPGTYRAQTLGTQRDLGVQLIRQTFDWSQIETSPGHYDLARYDGYVATLASHGMRVLPILFHTPTFHLGRTAGRASCPPADLGTFARYAQVLVARYGPNGTLWAEHPELPKTPITSWQIWNEPNLKIYWCDRVSAREYARMLRTVSRAIKQVDRKAEVVTAGLPPSKLKSAVWIETYLRQLYKAGGKKGFDTLAINSYAKNRADLRTLLRSMRTIMNRRKDARARIWITELGWGDAGPASRFNVGAAGQATRIASSFKEIRRLRKPLRLRGVVYYTWRDAAPYPPEYKDMWGLHTGLLDMNHNPKPAYWAFRDAVAKLK